MAYSNPGGLNPLPFSAGGAIEAYRLVAQHSVEGQVVATSAITQVPIGGSGAVTAASGDQLPVHRGQVIKLTAGEAIALGAQVMPLASGAGKIGTAAGATAKSCGIALQAALADGDVISVLFMPSVNSPANA